MRTLLLAVLLLALAGPARATEYGSVPSAAVAASTATVILDYNGNATVPYGVVAASGAFSGLVTVSSLTTTGGTGVTIKAASGEGTSGQGSLNLANAGYGASDEEWVGNTGNVLGLNGATTMRLHIANSSKLAISGSLIELNLPTTLYEGLAVTGTGASNSTFYGSSFTFANTGVVSAPSQPGARADTLSLTTAGTLQRAVFFQLYWSGASTNGSYNKGGVWAVTSSDTFKANGAGVYLIQCQIGSLNNTGTNNSMKVYASVNGTVRSEKMNAVQLNGTWSATLTDMLLLADGDLVTFKIYSDDTAANPTVTNDNKNNFAIVQKIW